MKRKPCKKKAHSRSQQQKQRHHDPQRQVWRQILLDIGMRAADLDSPRGVSADLISDAAERAGFPPETIAEILRTFCGSAPPGEPDCGLPDPAFSLTRENRVELMERRAVAKQALYHPGDIVPDILDDHVTHAPEGKPRVHWYEEELAAEHEEAEQADNLAQYDTVPRRLWQEWEERQRHRQRPQSEGSSGSESGCEAILGAA